MKLLIQLFLWSSLLTSAQAADLKSLQKLFYDNFETFYEPRYCGRNVQRLLSHAEAKKIDLTNAYVLKVVGGGFLETSGFYTRVDPNERAMLGYFHMILVADGYVFDFDLYEPMMLKMEDYLRLQFTPPYEPYIIWGINYSGKKELSNWTVTRFEWHDYVRGKEKATWQKKMNEFVSLDQVMSLKRIR